MDLTTYSLSTRPRRRRQLGVCKELQPFAASPVLDIPNDRSGYGTAVDIDGDNVIVRAPGIGTSNEGVSFSIRTGRHFHYSRNFGGNDNWGQTGAFLTSPGKGAIRAASVAISGNNYVVGIPLSNEPKSGRDMEITGSGLVGRGTVPDGSNPSVSDFSVTHAELNFGTNFANQIAASKGTMFFSGRIGNPIGDSALTIRTQGLAVLTLFAPQTTFSTTRKILPIKPKFNVFGTDLTMNQDQWLVVGDRFAGDDLFDPLRGQAYLYHPDIAGTEFQFVKELNEEVINTNREYGSSFDISLTEIAAGAPGDTQNGIASGTVYLYSINQGGIGVDPATFERLLEAMRAENG